jgi:hypothetical protein
VFVGRSGRENPDHDFRRGVEAPSPERLPHPLVRDEYKIGDYSGVLVEDDADAGENLADRMRVEVLEEGSNDPH